MNLACENAQLSFNKYSMQIQVYLCKREKRNGKRDQTIAELAPNIQKELDTYEAAAKEKGLRGHR